MNTTAHRLVARAPMTGAPRLVKGLMAGLLVLPLSLLLGCGGANSDPATPHPNSSVTMTDIAPAAPFVTISKTITFAATASGGTSSPTGNSPGGPMPIPVTWSVSPSGGTINPTTGLFTAPGQPGTVTITGTPQGYPAAAKTTLVTVVDLPEPPSGALNANPVLVDFGDTSTLSAHYWNGTATLTGLPGVNEVPDNWTQATPGMTETQTYTLKVTNKAGDFIQHQATVRVRDVTIDPIKPANPVVRLNSTTKFETEVHNAKDKSLDWSATGGTFTGPGQWQAPSAGGVYTIKAASHAKPSVFAMTQVTVQAGPQIVSFTANPNPIAPGAFSNLTAVFSGGTGVVDQGIGSVSSGVSVPTGPLFEDRTYVLTVTGFDGSILHASVTVRVEDDGPRIISFVANPSTIDTGASSNLTASFSGGTGTVDWGIGSVVSGVPVATGALSATRTYTLTVTSTTGRTVTATATVTVVPLPTASLTAAPSSVLSGQSSILTPAFTGGTGQIDHGIGLVLSGVGVSTGPLTTTTIFTLTVTSPTGRTATASASVTVGAGLSASLSAAPSTIPYGGTSMLTWATTGATAATINNGIGPVAPVAGGSITTPALTATTTYTLTVTNAAGTTATATATVSVAAVSIAPIGGVTTCTTGSTYTYTTTVSGAVDVSVAWSCSAGTINASGVWQAPGAPGTYTIRATSNANPSVFTTLTITVVAPPAVADFSIT